MFLSNLDALAIFALQFSRKEKKDQLFLSPVSKSFVQVVHKFSTWRILSSDESYDLGYRPSPCSMDQSAIETSTTSSDSFMCRRTNSDVSAFSESVDDGSYSADASPSCWPNVKSTLSNQAVLSRLGMKKRMNFADVQHEDLEAMDSELELLKERFAKLLLGEDMSGSGKGVCTAVTISNSTTNLYATIFGANLRLEPLNPEKKAMWKREMDCLLSVCNYIVELTPVSQNLPIGKCIEMMTSRPRSDIYINLPALKKLDAMLIEVLDSFQDTEFWYAEQGSISSKSATSASAAGESFRRISVQRGEDKWWLPVPCVPPGGLSEKSRKDLRYKRDSCNQIHKAAMAINSSILSEMEIPESYIASLPKSGKACLGDWIYRYMNTSEKFSPECLLDCLNIASEHEALELTDRVESSMYTWRRKACMSNSKASWVMAKDEMSETDKNDKNYVLAERAECLLFSLKQRYPELSQTSLDTCKIQYNKDVGQAVLESYSRVLESFAYNIVAWIEDVIHVDRSMRCQDK